MIGTRSFENLMWLLLALFSLPWLISQMNVAIPGDMAWLSLAAEKFLAGERMTAAFHDNNPPMSYMIFAPVAFLTKAGWALPQAALAYGAGVMVLFSALLAIVARKGMGVQGAGFAALIIGYLLPLAFLFQGEMGNKDYLIAAALPPFLLAQMAVTDKAAGKWYVWLTLILATPFILLKPHYGLLPACLLLHRFMNGHGLRVMRDPDFICLTAGVLLYALATFLWFPDFLSDVLWDVSLGLYAGSVMNAVFKTAALMALLSAFLIVLAKCSDADESDKKLAQLLTIMALAAVIPFAVQLKGFSLHMIPYLALCCPAVLMLAVQYVRSDKVRVMILIGTLLGGYVFSVTNAHATPGDFRIARFAALIRAHTSADHGFMMQDTTTNVAIPLAVYGGVPHASRFSSLWFVRALAQKQDVRLIVSYAGMMADDLNRYKPAVVLLYHDPRPQDDLLALFGPDENFRKAWSAYRKAETVPFDKNEFYKRPGLVIDSYPAYDLYIRE